MIQCAECGNQVPEVVLDDDTWREDVDKFCKDYGWKIGAAASCTSDAIRMLICPRCCRPKIEYPKRKIFVRAEK